MGIEVRSLKHHRITNKPLREFTVNSVNLNIHHHFGYSVHVTWRTGADVTMKYYSAADTYFERWFDTEDGDSFCKDLKRNATDSLCDYGLYGKYVAAVTSSKQNTPLPRLSHTYNLKYGQTEVEAARIGERVLLQMSLSNIIFSADVRRLVFWNVY